MIELPKKKKAENVEVAEPIVEDEPLETDVELTEKVKEKIFAVEQKPKEEAEKPSDTVKLKVLIGTLHCEEGTFEKGEVFQVSKKRAEHFDKTSVEILG